MNGCLGLAVLSQETIEWGANCYNKAKRSPVTLAIASHAHKTVDFVKNHWKQLTAYTFAWALIVVLTGSFYGFNAVALPLTIGISCGLGFGAVTGILISCSFNKGENPDSKTIYGKINSLIMNRIDANGTRNLLLAIAVSVVIAAAIIYPYAIGAIFGIVIGNYFATLLGYWDPNEEKAKIQASPPTIDDLHARILALEAQLAARSPQGSESEPDKPIWG